jgi:membrane-associated protein
MELINELLSQYSGNQIYAVIFGLMLLTSLGMFPGSTDLFLIALGIITASGSLKYQYVVAVCLLALSIGESIAYLVGSTAGKKLFQKPFFQKEKFQKRYVKLEHLMERGFIYVVLSLRFIPILRPYNIAMSSTLVKSVKKMHRYHMALLFLYVPSIVYLSKSFSDTFRGLL